MLTNVYSEGIVPVTTGARGVLDGRAPYADAKLLGRANDAPRGAPARSCSRPGERRAAPVHGHHYLLLATDGRWSLASPFVFPTDFAGPARPRTDLELVSEAPGLPALPGA